MKTITAVLFLMLALPAVALTCGYPPYPPYGCHYECFCDANGQNCRWQLICK